MSQNLGFTPDLPLGLGNKQLTFAAPHVSGGWFPINPDLFHSIKGKISEGKYNLNVDLLLEDLKSDYALFAYCLRELSRMLHSQAPAEGFRPIQLVRTAGIEKISEILNKPIQEISRHQLSEIDAEHAKQLSTAMTSACAAEVLARNQEVDPDTAFSCALFRQLGLTLIAWNYPHVYKRVTATTTSKKNVDQSLSRVLGFSPSLLGITLAREWGIAPEIRYVMGEKSLAATQESLSGTALKEALVLEKLGTIGETLAEMNYQDKSATAQVEWNKARNEILRQIGSKGLSEINSRLEMVCKHYLDTLPNLFTLPVSKKLVTASSLQHSESLIQSNTYVQFLSEDLKLEFKSFYNQVKPEAISKESIDYLINKIVPKLGFEKGCIYLVDPGTTSLMPRLSIGKATLNQFSPSNYLAADNRSDPILLAYRSSSPVLEKCMTLEGPRLRYITGAIGKLQRGGVLYLEPSENLQREDENKVLLLYKAILQSLADCLTLA